MLRWASGGLTRDLTHVAVMAASVSSSRLGLEWSRSGGAVAPENEHDHKYGIRKM